MEKRGRRLKKNTSFFFSSLLFLYLFFFLLMSYQILIVLFTLLQATLAAQEERIALSPSSPEFWGYLAVVILLVALSGLLAGRIVKKKNKDIR
jgi:VIT1/CCC1 family predicted Fe2+/Mn2+ transporter